MSAEDHITIYHNPRCSKSRQSLELLREHNISPEIMLYLENPPTSEELESLLAKLELSPRELLRRSEQAYTEHGLANPALTDAQIIEAMVSSPKLIERPIIVSGNRAVIGRPPEKVLELIV